MKKHSSLTAIPQWPAAAPSKAATPAAETNIELSALREPWKLDSGAYIKIDHATLFDNIAVVTGWASDDLVLDFPSLLASESIPRPDASAAVGQETIGFIAVLDVRKPVPVIDLQIAVDGAPQLLGIRFSTTAEDVTRAMQYYTLFSSRLLGYFTRSRLFGSYLATICNELPASMRVTSVNGHLDIAKCFPGYGYVAYGWAFSRAACAFWLLSEKGEWHSMSQAMWFNRPDVTDSFSDSFGVYASESAFFSSVNSPAIDIGSRLRLVAATDQGLFTVHEITTTIGPQTPLSYARWAFALPTPPSRFLERMDGQDGALIDDLISRNRGGYPTALDVWETKGMPPSPEISVIVPLYGRADFVEYQLTKFAQDIEFLSGKAELIYVIDDPRLVEGMRQSCHQLTSLYKVPFRVVWGKINRGYSGANNLGLKHARGKTIILLNSDVFPIVPGWASQMASTLQSDETIGAVGARLEYADGSVQHQGMAFDFAPEWKVWLNKHPGQGLAIPALKQALDVEAATGACLAVRHSDLVTIGGLDEGFLIGDFEDSDLCMKLRMLRSRIVVLPGTRLVHLERQSFSQLGSDDFRTNVVKYNAWRHTRLWGKAIAALKEKQQ